MERRGLYFDPTAFDLAGVTGKRAAPMTMADVATLAGVAESTVSRALADNPLIAETTRRRIQEIARRTGFVVNPLASGLRSRRSNVVSVLITLVHERTQHVSDPFMMAMLAHVADALAEAGYDMLLSKISEHEDAWIERLFRARRPAGALLIGQSLEHAAIERAARAGLPLVVWGAKLERQSYVTVGTDNVAGGMLATRHLIEQGCQRIVFLGEPGLPELAQRIEGYRRAHREAGLKLSQALIVPCGFDPALAADAAGRLVGSALEFDGIVAGSDVIAMSAMRVLRSAGRRVPEDVAVVGFDDVDLAAHTMPSLTTVRQDFAHGAARLTEKLIALMAGTTESSEVLPATLIVRESSARAATAPRPASARR